MTHCNEYDRTLHYYQHYAAGDRQLFPQATCFDLDDFMLHTSIPPPDHIPYAVDMPYEESNYSSESELTPHTFSRSGTFGEVYMSNLHGEPHFPNFYQTSLVNTQPRYDSPMTVYSNSSFPSPQSAFSDCHPTMVASGFRSSALFGNESGSYPTLVSQASFSVSPGAVHHHFEHPYQSSSEHCQGFSDSGDNMQGHLHTSSYSDVLFPISEHQAMVDDDTAGTDSEECDIKTEDTPPTSRSVSELNEDYNPGGTAKRRCGSRTSSTNSSPTRRSIKILKRRSSDVPQSSFVKRETPTNSRASGDPRPFPCPLRPYGCTSTFTSKNEWKRHVNVQHADLTVYRCDQCLTTKAQTHCFNRKDLFTQHLDRMHSPSSITTLTKSVGGRSKPRQVTNQARKNNNWSESGIYQRCLVAKRQAPQELACVFCEEPHFRGKDGWENWLEHVGQHLAAFAKQDKDIQCDAYDDRWRSDSLLRDWLLQQGLLVTKGRQVVVADKTSKGHGPADSTEKAEEDAMGDAEL